MHLVTSHNAFERLAVHYKPPAKLLLGQLGGGAIGNIFNVCEAVKRDCQGDARIDSFISSRRFSND